ncbi:vWA domain-containing protein [Novipirellula artificiosorum]|uniref:VWFA domain-containing protein n=1 Tax=Novipirellula artificiosorum TaxID=2528016 RepID=A0A5C6E0I8_9BACT|nr:vWA domain-containing protein [Novipirellula artificiosorum]TWU42428.1 hypothetical protein Poly41_07250 [Novipirellula artificiosorum]
MKRPFNLFLVLAVMIGFGQQTTSINHAQDVTITIEKGKKESKAKSKAPFTGKRPAVDVAILLDTSNSMDGLIDQAKSQLWNIVQEFAKAKKNGRTPELRVSVFEYGNSGLPAREGYIRQVIQLTDDLDKVSEALFALRTGGGDEYCGAVINEAIKRLDWSGQANAYKAIFIAGNEPFTQGSVDYKSACRNAIESGIVVNTIHCGDYQRGVQGKWKDGADMAEGEYMNINQDEKVVHIQCPQDKIIIELNSQLNETYLWYGSKNERTRYAENQVAQDLNASSLGGLSSRAATKAGSLYRNVGRDLVDTFEEDEEAILQLKADDLPEELRKLTPTERLKKVAAISKLRAEIKAKLATVSKERQAYLAAERAKMTETPAAATLGDAFAEAVEEQLVESGFDLSDE